MKYYIYKIVNSIDDKVYIGSTTNFEKRIKQHSRDSITKSHPIQIHIRTVGLKNCDFIIVNEIDVLTKLEARIAEQEEINKYDEDQLLNGQKARMTKEDRVIDKSRTNRIRYENIKSDPEKYKAFLEQKKEWKRQYRANKKLLI